MKMVKYKNQHRGGFVYSIFSKNSFAGKIVHDIFQSLLQCQKIYATFGQLLRTSVLNPVIMVENICTLILAVHTILPHFKANFPLRVILFVSPYTQSREIFIKLLRLSSYKFCLCAYSQLIFQSQRYIDFFFAQKCSSS